MPGTELTIGEVARRTGLTERTLRYYEDLGLVSPGRDAGGRRRYDGVAIDRLYRVRLLRDLGTPLADVDPETADLVSLTRRHLAGLDDQVAELARRRERVRAVEERLLAGHDPTDAALLDLLSRVSGDEQAPTRRITLLVYRDLAVAHAWLVDVFGLGAGPVSYDGDRAVHGELHVGDGVLWLHPEKPEHGLRSPLSVGGAVTASLAIAVDDVDAHHAVAAAAGAEVVHAPGDQPYGYREYSARDLEGHLWSFQTPIPDPDSAEET